MSGKTCFAVALLSSIALGCGGSEPIPELGKVKGKVTLNGTPTADLDVVFEPQAKGDPRMTGAGSTGRTGPDGTYELTYQGGDRSLKGAVVGAHLVRVTSAAGGGPAGGETAAKRIALPASANTDSNITRDVTKGDNSIDIEIKSAKRP